MPNTNTDWQNSLRPTSPDPRGQHAHARVSHSHGSSIHPPIHRLTHPSTSITTPQSLSPPRSPTSPRGPDGGAWGRHGPFSGLEPTDEAEARRQGRSLSHSPPRGSSRRRAMDDLGGDAAAATTTTAAAAAAAASQESGVAALQRLGRLRVRAEAAFKKLTAQLPRRLDPAPPPPAFKPLTPAFDLGTLRRQVAALQVRRKEGWMDI